MSGNARILKMHINGSLWDFINIFDLIYVCEATNCCGTGNNILSLRISVYSNSLWQGVQRGEGFISNFRHLFVASSLP